MERSKKKMIIHTLFSYIILTVKFLSGLKGATRRTTDSLQLILGGIIFISVSGRWWCSSSTLVELGNNGLNDIFSVLLLPLEILCFSLSVVLQPLDLLINDTFDFLLLGIRELSTQLFLVTNLVLERVDVGFELVAGLDALLELLVLIGELLSIMDHPLDVFGCQTVLVVGDCDLFLVASTLVFGGNLEDTVGVDLECNFDLRNSTRSRRDVVQVEFACYNIE